MKRLIAFTLFLMTAMPLWASPPEPRLDIIRHVFGLSAEAQQQNFGGGGAATSFQLVGADLGTCAVGVVFFNTASGLFKGCATLNTPSQLGGGTAINATNNVLPKRSNATTFVDSSCTDNGTTFSCTEPLSTTGSVSTGSGCTPAASTASGGICMTEAATTGWTPTAGFSYLRASSTHAIFYSLNGGGELPVALLSATPAGGKCMQSTGTVGLIAEGANACGSSAYPITITGGVSGGIPCFTATTTESASGILNTNILVKGGGAGVCPTNSLATDDATQLVYTGTGGIEAPIFEATGTTAGFIDFAQGTTSAAVDPCNVATSICFQAPAAVTSYLVNLAGAAATGIPHYANAANVITETISAINLASADVTGNLPVAQVPASTGLLSGAWNCVNVTPVTTAGGSVTTDQNMQACTVPAATLNLIGKTLKVHSAGVYSTAAASTTAVSIETKLCTVSGCGSGTVVDVCDITSAAIGTLTISNDTWMTDCILSTQTAGASSVYERSGMLAIDLVVSNLAADSVFLDSNATAVTAPVIDNTGGLFLQIAVAFTVASASNVATGRSLVVESIQ
jgi:hypothetical protein